MPEYNIPIGDDNNPAWSELDDFTRGYIEAMFFTNCSVPDDGDLEGATYEELAPVSLWKCIAECASFKRDNAKLLAEACQVPLEKAIEGYDMERAGNDFWYTRCGHGVGFWDRGLGACGDALSDLCGWPNKYGERWVERGDDGRVYIH